MLKKIVSGGQAGVDRFALGVVGAVISSLCENLDDEY
jgi:hypothetical protein